MLVFTINRIIQSIIVIFLTSIVIFAGIFAIGNPVDLLMDSRATFEEMEQIKANLGLDKPFWEQPLGKCSQNRFRCVQIRLR